MDLKQELFKQCAVFVNKRSQTVEEIISSNQKALQSETKSSAGDKHETGRAMLQLEMEKASQQLAGISVMNQILAKIDASKTSDIAHLGSIVITEKANYFLSISAGKLTAFGKDYYAVSVSSPIGKILLGKKVNEEYSFNKINNKVILIK
ncbi:GreA/GreB family elongation factor [Polaribacter vadi]|uniref:GreA/GreB family elongation factor n=1 Tax=Polaribacter sp. 1_MG-2023 TaxID=3062621 RepID=UPI001C09CC08|nr:GreA/GreB family elongation factor [Polaribacter sp. 1_MG-2023]MBU3011409.1 GreA/GreB family elongation factor [Polaribacter vadi]MDO6741221.1 GreA/GreB family elongation factor [Polaribacter sp. 1_MG-2023]